MVGALVSAVTVAQPATSMPSEAVAEASPGDSVVVNHPAAGIVGGLSPQRVLDTRHAAALAVGGTRVVSLANVARLPDDAGAVWVNLAVPYPRANGYLTA